MFSLRMITKLSDFFQVSFCIVAVAGLAAITSVAIILRCNIVNRAISVQVDEDNEAQGGSQDQSTNRLIDDLPNG